MGEAWRGRFGKPTWSFDHKGVHFIGMNSILVRDFWTAAGMTAKQRMDTMEMLEEPRLPAPGACARSNWIR